MSYLRRKKAQSKVRLRVEELERRDAPAVLSTFAVAGVEFNDATRRLDGGLWQFDAGTPTESNQGRGFVTNYVTDLTNVRDTINSERLAGGPLHNVSEDTNEHLNAILNQITLAIGTGAMGSVGNAQQSIPGSLNARAHETAIRTEHLQIISIVNNDDFLADKAITHNDTNPADMTMLADGIQGFQKIPPKLAEGLDDAPRATFNDIGRIFNDAANRIMGGLGSTANVAAIKADINVMYSSLTELAQDMQGLPGEANQLARLHVTVIRDQLPLWVRFINGAASNTDSIARQVAPKGSNDITLDLIDIAQGDPVLAATLSEDNPGWAMYPVYSITQPRPYQDNLSPIIPPAEDLTVSFFAHMDSDSINLGNEGIGDIGASPAVKAAYLTRLRAFGANIGAFDAAKGGIFEARFDNELVAINSTTGAAIVAMGDALAANNLAEAQAAAFQMHANTADVSGNNRWVSFDGVGGSILWHKYNTDGTTPDNNPVTGVLNPPGTPTLVL
jgi:hypothetical protein